ncbi:MAG: hypothetical protein GKR93_12070 [Gammaproteobacteria bacterium]|nr:hypothetical protein [Gammaproteobacteria bacterium]
MTLNITCPNCSITFPLIAGLSEADARRFGAMMGEVPPKLSPLVLQYLHLFKPKKSGLSFSRAKTLLVEILAGIKAGQVERNGRSWIAPNDHWAIAMQEMIDRREKLTLPMKNHGYLFDIIAGLTDKTESKEENATEKKRQQGVNNSSAPKSIGEITNHIGMLERFIDNAGDDTTLQKELQSQLEAAKSELDERRS